MMTPKWTKLGVFEIWKKASESVIVGQGEANKDNGKATKT